MTKGMYDKPINLWNDLERPPKLTERPQKKTWKMLTFFKFYTVK